MSSSDTTTLECDVLVVGGGLAGCWATLRAADFAPSVILADKGKVARSGMSPLCGGYILCPVTGDDLDPWHRELARQGEYMSDQDWVRVLLEDLPARIKEMDSWTPVIEKDEKGNYRRFKARGHVDTRCVVFDARRTLETLREKLGAKGVKIVDRTMIVHLLTSDGRHPTQGQVVGALGLNSRTAQPTIIKAGAVILATGGSAFGDDLSGLSGDGIGLALRAGAEITGLEFSRWWANWLFNVKYRAGHLNQWQAVDWYLLNRDGERFMEKYFPELKERARQQDLSSGIGKEYVEGRGPVYADFRHVSAEALQWSRTNMAMLHVMRALEQAGLSLEKEKIRFDLCPGFFSFEGGGVKNNTFAETSIAGLYAAGQAGGYPTHGTYSVGGVNIGTCSVSGYRAGEFAAKYALENGRREISKEQVLYVQADCLMPIERKRGVKPQDIRNEMGDYMSHPQRAFFRHEKRLRELLAESDKWKGMIAEVKADNPHELIKANSLKNYALCWELAFLTSLVRKETRGACLREDYPYTDNRDWLRRIVVSQHDDRLNLAVVPIPMYRYPARPENTGVVPFPFPMPTTEQPG